jgi:CBS domain-containing protein
VKRWLYAVDTVGLGAPRIEQRLARLRQAMQTATGSPPTEPAGDGSFLIDVPARAFGRDLAKQVRVHPGVIRHRGSRTILPITWQAEPSSALFPSFDGSLEIEELDQRCSQVTLVGAATPPLGPLGAVLDAALLRSVGEQTARRLVRALCRTLEDDAAPPEPTPPTSTWQLTVGDLMTRAPLIVDERTSLRTCAQLMHDHGVSGLPVIDERGELCGVLSERDLLPRLATDRFGLGRRAEREERLRAARTAGAACSRPARCTATDSPLAAAVREMLDHEVSRLVVLDAGQVVGIITRHDVILALTRSDVAIESAITALLEAHGYGAITVDTLAGNVRLHGEVARRTQAADLARLVATVQGVDTVDDGGVAWRVDDQTPLMPPHLV